MDRLSFIQQNNSNQTESKCGEGICECDEIRLSEHLGSMKKIDPFHLIVITTAAFFCAFVFAEYKNCAVKTNIKEWLYVKKGKTISCSTNELVNKNQSVPIGDNNGNGCTHQFGSACFLSAKQKKNKIHSC